MKCPKCKFEFKIGYDKDQVECNMIVRTFHCPACTAYIRDVTEEEKLKWIWVS